MELGDLATWVGALATAAAGGFAGWQLLLLRRQQAEAVRAERDGVAVTWVQKEKPREAEPDGSALWHFEITVHNPGRLPIRNVEIAMTFPRDVNRVHFDRHIDGPTRVLELGLPVLAGSSAKSWDRELRMEFDEGQILRTISAKVRFVDLKGQTHLNEWGSETKAR